jgi:hypothetical protein
MKTLYRELFSVTFRHDYFADADFTGITALPDEACHNTLINNELLFKKRPTGFTILYNELAFGRKRSTGEVINGLPQLRFVLQLTDNNFYNYTTLNPAWATWRTFTNPTLWAETAKLAREIKAALAEKYELFTGYSIYKVSIAETQPITNINNCSFLFTNKPALLRGYLTLAHKKNGGRINTALPIPAENINNLHGGQYVAVKDVVENSLDTTFEKEKQFGEIIIDCVENLKTNYYIRFRNKKSCWRYILISNYVKKLELPEILSVTANNSEKAFLKQLTNKILSTNEDIVVFTSIKQYPLCHTFSSTQLFSLVNMNASGNGNYTVVKRVLPTPDVNAISNALPQAMDSLNVFSDIFL